jgi:hypothetical protein
MTVAPPLDQLEQLTRQAINAGAGAAIDQLGARIDSLQARRPNVECVNAALWYASIGLHVFPLRPPVEGRFTGKTPWPGTHGLDDATTDPDQIVDWWRRWPGSNVAIATGRLVDVIDVDGPDGVLSWARMGSLPPVLGTVTTPRGRGGSHLYIPAAKRAKGVTQQKFPGGFAPGIDYRGLGGYVAAPPSYVIEHPKKGGYRGRYSWRRPLDLRTGTEA